MVENRDEPSVGAVRASSAATSRAAASSSEITDADFDVPTTIARSGGRLYVVNAKFAPRRPRRHAYEVVKVPKR